MHNITANEYAVLMSLLTHIFPKNFTIHISKIKLHLLSEQLLEYANIVEFLEEKNNIIVI